MKRPIFMTQLNTGGVSNSAARTYPLAGGSNSTSGAAGVPGSSMQPIALAGKFSRLFVRGVTPLTQGNYLVELVVNGTATALKATLTSAGLVASNVLDEVAVAPGDLVYIRITPSGTPDTQTGFTFSALFTATTDGKTQLFAYQASSTVGAAYGLGSSGNGLTEAQAACRTVGGLTIDSLYVHVQTAPGTGNARSFQVRAGPVGALVDVGSPVVFGATDTGVKSLTAIATAVAAGNYYTVVETVTGTPAASSRKVTLGVTPVDPSNFSIPFYIPNSISQTAERQTGFSGVEPSALTTDVNLVAIAPVDMTIKSIGYEQQAAPGTGKSRALTLRKNQIDTTLVTTVSDAALFASTAQDIAVSAGDLFSYKHNPAGTPASTTWTKGYATAAVITAVSSAIAVTEKGAGFGWEGKRGPSSLRYNGAYTGVPTSIEARIVNALSGDPIPNFDWATKVANPSGGVFQVTFDNVPRGGPYRVQVQFGNDHTVRYNGTNDFMVGSVIPLLGQSQLSKLRSDGIGASGVPAFPTGMLASVLCAVNEAPAGTTTVAQVVKIDSPSAVGSGLYAAAVQIWNDTGEPVMFVDMNIPGTGLKLHNTDGVIPGTSVPIRTGFDDVMMAAMDGQITAALMYWGTALVSDETTSPGAFATDSETFLAYIGTKLGYRPRCWIMPHPRSCDDDGFTNAKNWKLRNAEYIVATTGDQAKWGLAGWLLDTQGDGDGSPHQLPGVTGGIRAGTRMGRIIASAIMGSSNPRFGPNMVEARFTSAGKTAIDITFDADIETPSGAVSNLPLFSVSTDNWAATTNLPAVYENTTAGFTAAIVSARKVRLTKTSGDWTAAASVKVDYCRSTPWDTEGGAFGGEANITTLLDQMLFGTDTFDGGRGLPASPPMNQGLTTLAYSAPVTYTEIPANNTTVTLTKAQAATLRVKDNGARTAGQGSEPVSLRWARTTGQLTGNPNDGINVPITNG